MSKQVAIKPNTNRLRQLVRDHGDVWTLVKGPKSMQCFNGTLGCGIISLDGKHKRNVPFDIVVTDKSI